MPGPINNFKRSDELNARFHQIVPAASHTYSKGEDQFPQKSPKLMARAKGAYCWDVDDNRYLDWAMGNRVIILGHAYPAVNEAVKKAIDDGANFTRPGILEYELAEYLVDFFPYAEMVKFGKNGSDVTTAAVKLSRAYTGRKKIARCLDHPFFAIHDWFVGTTAMHAGVPEEVRKLTVGFMYNDIESVERMFAENKGEIAGLILEPVKNEEPKDNFLQKLREICTREGTVLICDEMIAGMKFDIRGSHARYNLEPDLATFGKAIANGFAFSVLAGKREIMEIGGLKHDGERVFLLSQTHGSETAGLAACRATLDECQRLNVTDHVWSTGKKLVNGIRDIASDAGIADYMRVIGFDCNPQLMATKENGEYWPALHTSMHEELTSHGILMPWTTITYAHNEPELEMTFEAMRHAAAKIKRVIESGDVDGSFEGDAVKPVFRPYNRCKQSACGRLDPNNPQLDCCKD